MVESKNPIPDSWERVEIGALCDLKNGRAFKPSDWTKNGLKIVRIQNLNNPNAPYNHYSGEVRDRFLIKTGDLLFAWSGTPGTSFGAHIWRDERAVLNQHIFRVDFEESVISKKYFMYAINQKLNELIEKAHGGVGLRHVTKSKFEKTVIELPPFAEQFRLVRKIESLLSELDNAIENLRVARQKLEVYRQAVFKYAFEGKLTEQWREDEGSSLEVEAQDLIEFASSGGAISDSEHEKLATLPEGWAYIRLGRVIDEPKYGTSKKCDYKTKGVGVIRIPNIVSGVIDDSDLKFAQFDDDEIQAYGLRRGDLLVIRSNGSISIVGQCAFVRPHDEKYLYAGYLLRIRPNKKVVNSTYLHSVLSCHALRVQIEAKAKSTSGVNNINSGELQSLIIPLCSIREQTALLARLTPALTRLDQLEIEINQQFERAEALRQSILKNAFSGKLVAQDPHDEPASVLLERIKGQKTENENGKRKTNRENAA
jgi:type I restriction enzyme S subunit